MRQDNKQIWPFFSWRGRAGRMVSAYERHQKWWWLTVMLIMTSWISYDMGALITRADVFSANRNIKGVLTVESVVARATETSGGRLIIVSQNDARFIDVSGSSWSVPGFPANVSKKQLSDLSEAGVVMDGEISMSVKPVRTKPSDMILATIGDVTFKLLFLSVYVFLIYVIAKQFRQPKKGRFRRIDQDAAPPATINDVAGYEGVKAELLEIVDYLRDPASFQAVGARPPKGILLYGPPGNGKTLMAKAVAGEAQAAFFEQSASSFIQIFAGEGAKAVRRLFEEARRAAPSVIFIDEIDSIGADRGASSHDERVQTLNAILTEMDGFQDNTGLVVVAATNRLDVLDEALVRPGRFDRKVFIPMPNQADRTAILRRHATSVVFEQSIDWPSWGARTQGFSAAELAALINEAAIEAARARRASVTSDDLIAARDRVCIGAKLDGRVLSPSERATVALHEAGHALVRIAGGGRVEKISLAPRGASLGVTVSAQEDERFLQTRPHVNEELRVLLAGRAAELLVAGVASSAAADDMRRASALARQALAALGSSSWGAYVPQTVEAGTAVEQEAADWVNAAAAQAVQILSDQRSDLDRLVLSLMDTDELTGDELLAIIAAKTS